MQKRSTALVKKKSLEGLNMFSGMNLVKKLQLFRDDLFKKTAKFYLTKHICLLGANQLKLKKVP